MHLLAVTYRHHFSCSAAQAQPDDTKPHCVTVHRPTVVTVIVTISVILLLYSIRLTSMVRPNSIVIIDLGPASNVIILAK